MTIKIADRLIALRRARGLSQEDVANHLGVSRQAVSKWERVEASPDADNLIALLQLYDTTLEELLHGKETSAPAPSRSARQQKAQGQKLRSLREAHGMTTAGLSAALNVPEELFTAWENGDIAPSTDDVIALSQALGVSTAELTEATYVPDFRFGRFDEETEAQKAQALAQQKIDDERRYRRGQILARIILAVEFFLSISSFLLIFRTGLLGALLSLALEITLLVFWWKGKFWARAVLAAFSGLSALAFLILTIGAFRSYVGILVGYLSFVLMLWRGTLCVLLLTNRSIQVFLEEKP